MPNIITVDDVKKYLKQWEGFPEEDVLFASVIDRAESIITEYLGFEFGDYPASATARLVPSYGTPTLLLPPHQIGSITAVRLEGAAADIDPTTYTEDTVTGNLTFDGYWPYASYPGTGWWGAFSTSGYWGPARYSVTAKWGYGTAPDAIVEVALELAVNIFRGRDRGMWTDVLNVEGSGGLRFTGGVTNQQRAILDSVRERFSPEVAI